MLTGIDVLYVVNTLKNKHEIKIKKDWYNHNIRHQNSAEIHLSNQKQNKGKWACTTILLYSMNSKKLAVDHLICFLLYNG